ncbi:MAG: hypothetical protein IJD04_03770 [Desulfovibrionaceae bacterium]|nr:hypothetical protein [Desulfovibrionaceae bacterium]
MDTGLPGLLASYSNEVMSYTLAPVSGEPASAEQPEQPFMPAPDAELNRPPAPEPAAPRLHAEANPPAENSITENQLRFERLSRMLTRSGRGNLALFGAGNPEFISACARLCRENGRRLFLCELNLHRARILTENPIWMQLAETCIPVFDASSRALLTLLAGSGLNIENTLFHLTPPAPDKSSPAAELKKLQACMRLVQRSRAVFGLEAPPCSGADARRHHAQSADLSPFFSQISVMAILHPEEPGLAEFCAHIPAGIRELVIVWDSPRPLSRPLKAACPIVQACRDLNGDFSAQRNFALSLCRGEWALALDGDERLEPQAWETIGTAVCEHPATAFFLPRFTLFPDKEHFRMGYGLWPDYQLRLFQRTEKTFFTRPVHEILTGFAGPAAILPEAGIQHLSYISKNRNLLAERLEVFNQAMGRAAHHLSREYPHLPLSWSRAFRKICPGLKYILFAE